MSSAAAQNTSNRKALIRAYKDRVRHAGVFAVRCAPTGQTWVEATPDIAGRQNGLWFALKHGSHPNKALQAAWTAQGDPAFRYEELERFPVEDLSDYELATQLKDRGKRWRAALGAERLTG